MAILAPWYLDETDFKRLVQVLHFKPNESPVNFINRITPLIKALPSHLKADRLLDPLRRFVTNAKKPRGQFCTTHKALSIELTEGLFTLVAQAAGVRLNHLVQYEDDLTAEQRQLVSRARRLHALWQEPKDYEDLFMESPDLAKFGYVSSCSACVLTVIGSDLPTITDLLTLAISSRRKNENTTAKFFRSYLDNTRTSAEAASAHMIADTAGAKLRIVRKQIRKVRKPEYDIDGLSSVHSSEVARQRTRSDSVSSRDSRLAFVDNDAAILSSAHLPPAKQKRFDASRLSLSTVAADVSSKGAHPYRRQVSCTSSVYTAHTVANNARVMDSNLKIPSAVFEEPITTEKGPASPEQEFAEYIPPRADWAKRMTADSQTLPLDRISQDRRNAYKALAGSSTSVFDRFNRQQPRLSDRGLALPRVRYGTMQVLCQILRPRQTYQKFREYHQNMSKVKTGWGRHLSPSQSHQIPGAISLILARGATLTRAPTRLAGLVSITVDLPRSLKSQETQFTAPDNPTINYTLEPTIRLALLLPHAVSERRHLSHSLPHRSTHMASARLRAPSLRSPPSTHQELCSHHLPLRQPSSTCMLKVTPTSLAHASQTSSLGTELLTQVKAV